MLELFTKAGIVAYPLGVCSVVALGIILERLWTLLRVRQIEDRAFMALQFSLEKGDTSGLRDPDLSTAPSAQVLDALSEIVTASEYTVQQAADIALSQQRLRLRRYLGTLATIGSTAPFIGLFGTVVGVMVAFHAMSQSGLSGEAMAAGISEALAATALGLLVAVPAIIAYNYFIGRVQDLLLHVHVHVARLVPLLRAARVKRQEVRDARPVAG